MGKEDMGKEDNIGAPPNLESDPNLFQPEPIPGAATPKPKPIDRTLQDKRRELFSILGI